MGRRPKWGQPVHGLLLLNKTVGISSNQALQQVKRLFNANRAGHTGALDPLATGMLPICLGEATKFTQFLLDSDKTYIATAQFGVTTDTADSDGSITNQQDASQLTTDKIESILDDFKGRQLQTPPQYSAVKHQGKPLYHYARQGIEVIKEPRGITIYQLQLLEFTAGNYPEARFLVRCSKGTYIRTLIADIGNALSCGAHIITLHRSQIANFEEEMHCIEALNALSENNNALHNTLLPVGRCVEHLQRIDLIEGDELKITQGQSLSFAKYSTKLNSVSHLQLLRCYDQFGKFRGLVRVEHYKSIKPQRIIS